MNYNTVYVGMDVHKESFTLCAYTIDTEKGSHFQRTEADYKNVLKYLEFLRTVYGNDANFICGYEAGCLGYTLYHQLTEHHVNCVILAPTTMLEQRSKRRIKTDRRDAEIIAKCLAQHNYSPVHIPTATDEETKEFLRMRDDFCFLMGSDPINYSPRLCTAFRQSSRNILNILESIVYSYIMIGANGSNLFYGV